VKTFAPKAVNPKACWSGRQSGSSSLPLVTGGRSSRRPAAHLIAAEGIASGLDGNLPSVEREVQVEKVEAFKTKSGNVRYVLRDAEGNEYTTFREAIARSALEAEGGRARIEFHEEQRNGFRNVYLDRVEPLEGEEGDGAAGSDVDEVAWKTAVEAAPLLVSDEERLAPEELFELLKPFKDRVAETSARTARARASAGGSRRGTRRRR
jgi:hypothetical protein